MPISKKDSNSYPTIYCVTLNYWLHLLRNCITCTYSPKFLVLMFIMYMWYLFAFMSLVSIQNILFSLSLYPRHLHLWFIYCWSVHFSYFPFNVSQIYSGKFLSCSYLANIFNFIWFCYLYCLRNFQLHTITLHDLGPLFTLYLSYDLQQEYLKLK